MKNAEVKQRGILIAHPRDEYDLLEERLLEALELERPRIRKGHYIGASKSDSDSGFESSSQNGTDDGLETEDRDSQNVKDKCPDCGTPVGCKIEQDRKWEIKIFAANGLMRSGAWSAAWKQMEKIDVEVAVWMPEDVRFEVEERLKALQAMEEAERPVEQPVNSPKKKRTRSNTARIRHDERLREIYGEPEKPRTQEEIDGLAEPKEPEHMSAATHLPDTQEAIENEPQHIPPVPDFVQMQFQQHEAPPQPDFFTFMRHHFRSIVNDQRNLAIVLLSALVLFFSVQNLDTSKKPSPQQSGSVQTTLAATEAATDTSVISIETPVVSFVTTTVLADPSSISSIVSSGGEVHHSQSLLPDDDYLSLQAPMLHESLIGSTMAEPTINPSTAEPSEHEPKTQDKVDVEIDSEANLSDTSEDVGIEFQAVMNDGTPSQEGSNEGHMSELTSFHKNYVSPGQQIDTLAPSDDAGHPELPGDIPAEPAKLDSLIDSNLLSTVITNKFHPENEEAIDAFNVDASRSESVSDLPDDSRLSSHHHPKETVSLTSASPMFPSLFTNEICMDTDQEREETHPE